VRGPACRIERLEPLPPPLPTLELDLASNGLNSDLAMEREGEGREGWGEDSSAGGEAWTGETKEDGGGTRVRTPGRRPPALMSMDEAEDAGAVVEDVLASGSAVESSGTDESVTLMLIDV